LIISIQNFLFGKFTISILVNGFEDLSEVLSLTLCQELTGNESEGGLLQFLISSESFQVLKGTNGN
jgi:hypothetical protein